MRMPKLNQLTEGHCALQLKSLVLTIQNWHVVWTGFHSHYLLRGILKRPCSCLTVLWLLFVVLWAQCIQVWPVATLTWSQSLKLWGSLTMLSYWSSRRIRSSKMPLSIFKRDQIWWLEIVNWALKGVHIWVLLDNQIFEEKRTEDMELRLVSAEAFPFIVRVCKHMVLVTTGWFMRRWFVYQCCINSLFRPPTCCWEWPEPCIVS